MASGPAGRPHPPDRRSISLQTESRLATERSISALRVAACRASDRRSLKRPRSSIASQTSRRVVPIVNSKLSPTVSGAANTPPTPRPKLTSSFPAVLRNSERCRPREAWSRSRSGSRSRSSDSRFAPKLSRSASESDASGSSSPLSLAISESHGTPAHLEALLCWMNSRIAFAVSLPRCMPCRDRSRLRSIPRHMPLWTTKSPA